MADISKIQLPNGEQYDIKDEILQNMIKVLLGIETEE